MRARPPPLSFDSDAERAKFWANTLTVVQRDAVVLLDKSGIPIPIEAFGRHVPKNLTDRGLAALQKDASGRSGLVLTTEGKRAARAIRERVRP